MTQALSNKNPITYNPPKIGGNIYTIGNTTTSKVSKLAFQFFVVVGVPALLIAGTHFHFYCLTSAFEMTGTHTLISQAMRLLKNKVDKDIKSVENKIYETLLLPEILKGNQKILSKLTMEELDHVLHTLPPKALEQNPAIQVEHVEKPISKSAQNHHENYLLDFEKGKQLSSLYSLQNRTDPKNGRIGFINGIMNDFASAYSKAIEISHLSGGFNVHGVHNATNGLATDIKECRLGKQGKITPPVWHLHKMWDDFFLDESTDPNAKFLLICHSQGAIHTQNALRTYDPELRQRIVVISVAGASTIDKNLCHSIHYLVSRDPVPMLREEKEESTNLTYVKPNGLINHSFSNPIYYEPLQRHIEKFINDQDKL